jgi:hypothetical protein
MRAPYRGRAAAAHAVLVNSPVLVNRATHRSRPGHVDC